MVIAVIVFDKKSNKYMFDDEVNENITLKERVYNFCMRGGVSFAELQDAFPEHFNQNDEESMMMMTKYENLSLWSPVSLEMIHVLQKLVVEERLVMSEASPTIYFMDGVFPIPPVAKRLKNYKKLHWLPVVFSPSKKK